MSRLNIALGIYVLLGLLAWFTLPDQRFRFMTIAILAFFALRAWTYRRREMLRERDEKDKHPDE
jgi:small basic protein